MKFTDQASSTPVVPMYIKIIYHCTYHALLKYFDKKPDTMLKIYFCLGLYYHVCLPCKDARYLRSSHE